ncbi:MAG: VWA domain-containing protein [Acidobacteria bacterium]|nr:VWA domain-containing protein [Acidobacteriota bacterium]
MALALAVLLVATALPASAATPDELPELSRKERRERLDALSEEYRQFLEDVNPIITRRERDLFLLLESDGQRDLFIDEFWRRRDIEGLTPGTYRDRYYARLAVVEQRFRHVDTDRARIYLIRGEPAAIHEIETCRYLRPIHVWEYHDSLTDDLLVFLGWPGDFRLWHAMGQEDEALLQLLSPEGEREGVRKVFYAHQNGLFTDPPLVTRCIGGDVLLSAIGQTRMSGHTIFRNFQPDPIDEDSIDRLLKGMVIEPKGGSAFEVDVDVDFPGRRGTRTIVRIETTVPASAFSPLRVGERDFRRANVTGEIMKDGDLFDRYEARFEIEGESDEPMRLVVERHLRPGFYELRTKVADAGSGGAGISRSAIEVPEVSAEAGPGSNVVEESAAPYIRLAGETRGILTGNQVFEAVTTPEVASVEFFVDGVSQGTKRVRPFGLEVAIGPVPRQRTVKAVARDSDGEILGIDELPINLGVDPFRVRIASPRYGKDLDGRIRVEVETTVPKARELREVELFVDDVSAGVLKEAPFVFYAEIDGPGIHILKAVARDTGESTTEDVVVLNPPPGGVLAIDVRFVELIATVTRAGRVETDLDRDAFHVTEAGNVVEITKFEKLTNQPLSVGLAIDTSASMEGKIDRVRDAASHFLDSVLTPADRAFVVTFDRQVWKPVDWTSDSRSLAWALAAIRPESKTALHDAIVESLYNFHGVDGQKALILLSDGRDNASKFAWDQALEYSRRSAVPIYVLGIGIPVTQLDVQMRLRSLAEATGGRAWFFDDLGQLSSIYEEIQRDLRSQYLLGFYPEAPDGDRDWRPVEIRVDGAEVRAAAGYYP